MANRVQITMPRQDLNAALAKMDVVQDRLENHAKKIKAAAEVLLAAHRKTGAHRIEVESRTSDIKFGHIDWYVLLVGPAPISVEFGHRAENGRWVNGLYIITRAGFSTR